MRLTNMLLVSTALLLACGDDTTGGGGSGGDGPSSGGGGNDPGGGAPGNGGAADGGSGGDGGNNGTGAGLPGGPSSQRTTLKPIGTVDGAPLGYVEYLPPGYGDGQLRPLLLFHHGIGESGDGSEAQLAAVMNTGLPALLKNDQWPEDRPFIVLSSQHDAPPFSSCHTVQEIEAFVAFAMEEYDVDPTRVYITGLSCGAIGSWNYLAAHTNEIMAAAVLIAGDGKSAFNQAGCDLGRVPIWAFHGDADNVVDESGSIVPINGLNECTNPAPVEAKITIYPGDDHNSWDITYDLSAGHDIYAWMLSYTNP